MNSREFLQNQKKELQKVFQSIKEERENTVKVGLGITIKISEFLVLFIFGILFTAGGLLPLTIAIISIFYPFDSDSMAIIIWSLAFILEAIGITTIVYFTRKISRRNDDLLENVVLKRAVENNGVLKEQDFYVRPFSKWRSKRIIKRFLKNGTIEIKDIRADGDIYFVPHLISVKEKQEAKDVFGLD